MHYKNFKIFRNNPGYFSALNLKSLERAGPAATIPELKKMIDEKLKEPPEPFYKIFQQKPLK